MKRKARKLELSFGPFGMESKEIYSQKKTKRQKKENGRNKPTSIRRN